MSWLAQLKNLDTVGEAATKPTEPGSVGFVAPVQGVAEKFAPDFRTRWRDAAMAAGVTPDAIDRLPAAELELYRRHFDTCADWYGAAQAAACMLRDSADMRAGRVPRGWTAATVCRHCGPVLLHPDVVRLLDVRDGMPWALGCPWCHVTMPPGHKLPRPPTSAHPTG